MNEMNEIQVLTAFVRALEVGSFSAVGREIGISQSTVSKQIAMLEASLGVQLFARTTRRLNPTPEALQLHEHVRQLLDALETIKSNSRTREAAPQGMLRLTAPTSFGRERIIPLLPEFLSQYPRISVDIVLTDRVVDLIEEGFELAIRAGNLPSSSMIARSLGLIERVVVGTPAYFSKHGTPETPAELVSHNALIYTAMATPTRWEFESEHGRQVVEVDGTIRSNDLDSLYDLVLTGAGIAAVPDWLAAADIAAGRLRSVLADYYLIPLSVNIVYSQTRFLTHRARCFIDFTTQALKRSRPSII
jgi:DNA-binding transcriptional LysR family regulator